MTVIDGSSGRHQQLLRRTRALFWASLVWLLVVGTIGLAAGVTAGSVALIGWSVDCAIQAVAAVVVLWRFADRRANVDGAERMAQQVVGASFVLLVPYIVVVATAQLLSGDGAEPSWIGLAIAAIDVALMPLLGHAKTRLGSELGSPAMVGAGRQNMVCVYLSLAVLGGLAANALVGAWWADPIAALFVSFACLHTGIDTWRGNGCS